MVCLIYEKRSADVLAPGKCPLARLVVRYRKIVWSQETLLVHWSQDQRWEEILGRVLDIVPRVCNTRRYSVG